ncbi:MAG TPA: hypothetical protein VFH27_05245 [Longimicrobiaceae bacterium]|nr:hypothetical protein [Longimicrobiaceae bacterium]
MRLLRRAPTAPPRARALLRAFAALALVACATQPSRLSAQAGGGSLRVRVTDAETHMPVPRARAALLDGRVLVAGDDGTLLIERLEAGTVVLEVSHLGHATRRAMGQVPADGAGLLEVALRPEALRIAGVTASGAPTRNRQLLGFYGRVERGNGQYFTRAEIERINPGQVSELFRLVPGMLLVNTLAGDRPVMEGGQGGGLKSDAGVSTLAGGGPQRGAGTCPILYFLDGTPIDVAQGVISAEVDVREVEGVEVYRRVAMAPPQFRRTGEYCGVVLIWKREKIVGRGVREPSASAPRADPPPALHP